MQQITGTTKLLGVIGDPVEHSLSPVMHNAAIAHLELDYVYLPFPVQSKNLSQAIAGFEAIGLVGFNATIPHKQTLIALLAEISPVARTVGAVNTVWYTKAGWQGTNTDVEGFMAPLKRLNRDWQQINPVILGNGGAARAVVVGCAQLGCRQIRVAGRSWEKLNQFQTSWQDKQLPAALSVHSWEEISDLVADTELLINTTPIGMSPHAERSPIDSAVLERLKPGAIAYDLIYTPSPTRFLRQAQNQGATIFDGLEMLIHQGAAALQLWLQRPVPVEVMRQAIEQYLNRE